MNNVLGAVVEDGKLTCPKFDDLLTGRNVNNVDNIVFRNLGHSERLLDLNACVNILIFIRCDCGCAQIIQLVNIRTVNKGNLGADGLAGHSGFAEVIGVAGDFSDFIQPIANLNGGGGGLLPCEADFKLVHTAGLVHIDAVNVDMNGVARMDAGFAVFVVQNGGNCVAVHEGIPVIGKRHHTGGCFR